MRSDLHRSEALGQHFYAIAGDEVSRIFIATLHCPKDDHTLFITLDAANRDELATFASELRDVLPMAGWTGRARTTETPGVRTIGSRRDATLRIAGAGRWLRMLL